MVDDEVETLRVGQYPKVIPLPRVHNVRKDVLPVREIANAWDYDIFRTIVGLTNKSPHPSLVFQCNSNSIIEDLESFLEIVHQKLNQRVSLFLIGPDVLPPAKFARVCAILKRMTTKGLQHKLFVLLFSTTETLGFLQISKKIDLKSSPCLDNGMKLPRFVASVSCVFGKTSFGKTSFIRNKMGFKERVVLPVLEDFSLSFGLQFVEQAVKKSLSIDDEVLLHVDVSGYSYPKAFHPFLTSLILSGQVIDNQSGQMFSVPLNARIHVAIEFGFGPTTESDPHLFDPILGQPMTGFIQHLKVSWKRLGGGEVHFTKIHPQWPLPVLPAVQTTVHLILSWELANYDLEFMKAATVISVYCKEYLGNGLKVVNRGFNFHSIEDLFAQRGLSSSEIGKLWSLLERTVRSCPSTQNFNFPANDKVTPLRVRIFCISFARFLEWLFGAYAKGSLWRNVHRFWDHLQKYNQKEFQEEGCIDGKTHFENGLLENLQKTFLIPDETMHIRDLPTSFYGFSKSDAYKCVFEAFPGADQVTHVPFSKSYDQERRSEIGENLILSRIHNISRMSGSSEGLGLMRASIASEFNAYSSSRVIDLLLRKLWVLTPNMMTVLKILNDFYQSRVSCVLKGNTGAGKTALVHIFTQLHNCTSTLYPDFITPLRQFIEKLGKKIDVNPQKYLTESTNHHKKIREYLQFVFSKSLDHFPEIASLFMDFFCDQHTEAEKFRNSPQPNSLMERFVWFFKGEKNLVQPCENLVLGGGTFSLVEEGQTRQLVVSDPEKLLVLSIILNFHQGSFCHTHKRFVVPSEQ